MPDQTVIACTLCHTQPAVAGTALCKRCWRKYQSAMEFIEVVQDGERDTYVIVESKRLWDRKLPALLRTGYVEVARGTLDCWRLTGQGRAALAARREAVGE